jgi:hypothetical protein
LSEVDEYIDTDKSGNIEFPKQRYFTRIVSDVQSELAMINYFLEQQTEIVLDLIKRGEQNLITQQSKSPYSDSLENTLKRWGRVKQALKTLEKYKQRVRKIDGDAERIEKAIKDMLNLKRTHSSIKDAHSSLILSTAVIGFTVVTIVFAPLACLTALPALKIQGFGKLQVAGEEEVYDSGKLGGIFGK